MTHEQKPTLEEALAHYGVKGMKWGVRRERRRQTRADIKAAKKGQGVVKGTDDAEPELDSKGRLTGRWLGDFKNTKGEPVSTEYANMVMDRASRQKRFKEMVIIGSVYAAAILAVKST